MHGDNHLWPNGLYDVAYFIKRKQMTGVVNVHHEDVYMTNSLACLPADAGPIVPHVTEPDAARFHHEDGIRQRLASFTAGVELRHPFY
jgi:hypothetical protein